MKLYLRWISLLLVLAVGLLLWLQRGTPTGASDADSVLEFILHDEQAGFAAVDGEWEYRFPADHGPHPGFRSEVWYLSGNLKDSDGKRYGFQLAFFRLQLRPEAMGRSSAWGANQVFRAHFALADEAGEHFHAEERFSRAALGLSGASDEPVRVWLEDWSLQADSSRPGPSRFRLQADAEGFGLELELQGQKPPVPADQAQALASAPASAFRMYSMPRLRVTGTLRQDDAETKVSGEAWLDRAWGAVPVSRGQIALNRFALQLTDDRDILCLQLRRRDGTGTPIPSCLLIAGDGSTKSFRRREIRLEPVEHWRSSRDGTQYPLTWRLELPREALELKITALLEDQELDFAVRAWSGAVVVSGLSAGLPVAGQGHLELSGYSQGGGGA